MLDELLVKVNEVEVIADIAEMEENYDFFFNGQKITEFSSASYLDIATGVGFLLEKPENTNEIIGTVVDLFGSGFVELQTDLYLNGLEQDAEDFLELYSGVYYVETGISSSLELINWETETYSI